MLRPIPKFYFPPEIPCKLDGSNVFSRRVGAASLGKLAIAISVAVAAAAFFFSFAAFFVVALGFLILIRARFFEEVEVNRDRVKFHKRSLRAIAWEEPLRNYRGVWIRPRKNRCVVSLVHVSDFSRNVDLSYPAYEEGECRRYWAKYLSILGPEGAKRAKP